MKKILSTRKVGLNYEKLVLAVLESYSFQLKHTGGTGDGGQDFTGCWRLPQRNIPVIGECRLAESVLIYLAALQASASAGRPQLVPRR